jgi:hypothetical protein
MSHKEKLLQQLGQAAASMVQGSLDLTRFGGQFLTSLSVL